MDTKEKTSVFHANRHWLKAIAIGVMTLDAKHLSKFTDCSSPLICHVASSYLLQTAKGLHADTRTYSNSELWAKEAFRTLAFYPGNLLEEKQSLDDIEYRSSLHYHHFISIDAMKALMEQSVFFEVLGIDELILTAQGESEELKSFMISVGSRFPRTFSGRIEEFVQSLALLEIANRISNLSFENVSSAQIAVKTAERMLKSELPMVQTTAAWAIECISHVDAKSAKVQKIRDRIKSL